MIILLTNDDGIEAEGIRALEGAVGRVLEEAEVYVVAPRTEMSQVGHRVTTGTPLRWAELGERRWAVEGTPADCVRLALAHLLPVRPDWVMSGINRGGNLGQDIYISGTVAGAREAAFHGIKALSFSQYVRRREGLDWERSAARVAEVLRELVEMPLEAGEHWNLNLPHLEAGDRAPDLVEAMPERGPLPIDFEASDEGFRYCGSYSDRPRQPGSDVHVCFAGDISLTRLKI